MTSLALSCLPALTCLPYEFCSATGTAGVRLYGCNAPARRRCCSRQERDGGLFPRGQNPQSTSASRTPNPSLVLFASRRRRRHERRASPFTVMLNACWASRTRRQTQEEGDEERRRHHCGLDERPRPRSPRSEGRGERDVQQRRMAGQKGRRTECQTQKASTVATPDFWSTWTTPRERRRPERDWSAAACPLETNLEDKSATYSSLYPFHSYLIPSPSSASSSTRLNCLPAFRLGQAQATSLIQVSGPPWAARNVQVGAKSYPAATPRSAASARHHLYPPASSTRHLGPPPLIAATPFSPSLWPPSTQSAACAPPLPAMS